MKIAKIALIALLSLTGISCSTLQHIDIQECVYPKLETITPEQENNLDADTWLKLQKREAQIKAFANKQCKKIKQHNETYKD